MPQYDSRIRLNTVGFLPESPKQATVAAPSDAFSVVRLSDGVKVLSGRAAKSLQTDVTDTNEQVQIFDFSKLTEPGRYRLEVESVGSSAPFTIGKDVWVAPSEAVTRAMYLWRCGTSVEGTWNGITYRHAPCHLEDGWLDYVGESHVKRPSVGGWHDAGDYNKYVVNAGVSVGLMLKAWEHFPKHVATDKLGIPESGNGIPDLLDEIRWEIEWLLTMQAETGHVYHKLSARDFKYWGSPEKDASPRYFTSWSTAATADFTAMMAEFARAWRPYDAIFADRCLAAAKKSWAVLCATPQQVDSDQSAFKTGTYPPKDASHRLWAAAELFETTSDPEYLKDFETRAKNFDYSFSAGGPNWGDVQDLAFATYLLSAHSGKRDDKIVASLTKSLIERGQAAVETSQKNGYARPLGVHRESWNWGANGSVAGQTLLLHLADRLKPDPRYRATAHAALDFLFGRNFNGRSYVTGLGANPPEHPHDRRGEPAWPGYLVGGGWPDGRSWHDELKSFQTNEIAINWNAALIYALAAFAEPKTVTK
ncbi:MAG: glycoside hydrolase family 9 protein [Nibricoccus sp.]